MTERPIYGPTTAVHLNNVTPLLLPWTADPWNRLRPPLSVDAMRLSAELSAATYSMAVEPWLQAGWRDVTIQVDGTLTTLGENERWYQTEWKKHRVRSRIRQTNPVSQVLGALRQREGSKTGKAVIMLHPAPYGRYVVAVSFMGTGTRFYDWFSNFRMTTQDGVHKGFHELTKQFEGNEERIEFPETAKELGLERLTLAHVLREMKSPNSRFMLWLSGHSQGAAIMQVYAHRKITEEGVQPVNLVGYGFASPTVMTGEAVAHPAAYPLYHILNSDDVIPHCGAAVHLGVCLTYPADAAMRRRCYGWPRDEEAVRARLIVRPVLSRMQDTPTSIVQMMGLLSLLSRQQPSELLVVLNSGSSLPLDKLLGDVDLQERLRSVSQRIAGTYRSITGKPLPQAEVDAAAAEMQPMLDTLGLKRFLTALLQLMRYPHRMHARKKGAFICAYQYIVRYGVQRLIPSMWEAGTPPKRLTAKPVLSALTNESSTKERHIP